MASDEYSTNKPEEIYEEVDIDKPEYVSRDVQPMEPMGIYTNLQREKSNSCSCSWRTWRYFILLVMLVMLTYIASLLTYNLASQLQGTPSDVGNQTVDSNASLVNATSTTFESQAEWCDHWLKVTGNNLKAGIQRVDPDGPGGQLAFDITCLPPLNGKNWIRITHNQNNEIAIDGQPRRYRSKYQPFTYRIGLTYSVSNAQLRGLVVRSRSCRMHAIIKCQKIRGVCNGWVGFSGKVFPLRTGADICPVNGKGDRVCLCSQNGAEWTRDTGYITDKDQFPVTQMALGCIAAFGANIRLSIGPLECEGRA